VFALGVPLIFGALIVTTGVAGAAIIVVAGRTRRPPEKKI
jgi:hypothetical protein